MSRNKLGSLLGAALVTSGLAVMAPSLTTTAAAAEVVVDGGLESATGDPLDSPAWVEADSANDLLCSTAVCGLDGGRSVPHSGTTYAKFGPIGAGHTASLTQDVTIPDGAATLSYWLRIARVQAPFDSQLVVSVDGDVVKANGESSFADPSYDKYSVNLASYADGGSHTLAFEYTDPSGGLNVMLLDDVSIDAAALPVGIAADPASLGAVPDGNADCIQPGAPLDVTFAVTGISGHLADVAVRFKFDPAHSSVGDLGVTLIAPDGTTKAVIFDRTGQQEGNPSGFGYTSNVAGPYLFSDAAPADPSWWFQAGLPNEEAAPKVTPGYYRASAAASSPAHGANTLITPAFAGLVGADGKWTLRFEDKCSGDFGTVASARLLLTPATTAPSTAPPGTTAPDTTAPDTTITSSPANGVAKSLKVPFGFSATEAGSSFLCAVDTAAFAACPNPATMTVTSGAHTFRVAARDLAGNVDASPATVSFKAYDCATLDAKVVKLTKKVTKLKKAVKATKKALAKAEGAGDKAKIKKLTIKLAKLKKQLKKAKKQLKKAKAADAPCKA